MYNDFSGVQCENCDHQVVCSLKEQFRDAQQSVENVSVSTGNNSIKHLRHFDWIKPVKLECIHFSEKKPAFRSTEISP